MKRTLERLDVLALRGHEDVEVLGESGQPVHVDGHGAEDAVADTLPLQRPEHPDHGRVLPSTIEGGTDSAPEDEAGRGHGDLRPRDEAAAEAAAG